MFDPTLEARVAAAVATLIAAPDDDGEALHQLCEATAALLEAFLKLADDWPQTAFIDGLLPLSVELADDALQLTAAAIVEQDEGWVRQPLVASFTLDTEADALAGLELYFAYAERDPTTFDPAQPDPALDLPASAEGFRYRLSTEPEPD